MQSREIANIDPTKFREVLGHYPTGVAVITGIADDGEAIAMVVGTFSSVSLEPPLVTFMPTRGSYTFARLRSAENFTVNILANDQETLCRQLARPTANKLEKIPWTASSNGSPVLEGVVATIDCSFHEIFEAGDHDIVLGRVHHLEVRRPVAPLLFFQGGYGGFAPRSLMVSYDKELASAVTLAQSMRSSMEHLSETTGAEVTAYAKVGDDIATVASVVPEGMNHTTILGSRFPLMLPLGELFVAWESQETAFQWMDRAINITDEDKNFFSQRLEKIRQQGWSYSVGDGDDDALFTAISTYNDAELTPGIQRQISARISAAINRYQNINLSQPTVTGLTSIVVPVRDALGQVQLVLRLAQLPPTIDTRILDEWVNDLKATASLASESLSFGSRSAG